MQGGTMLMREGDWKRGNSAVELISAESGREANLSVVPGIESLGAGRAMEFGGKGEFGKLKGDLVHNGNLLPESQQQLLAWLKRAIGAAVIDLDQ